MADFKSFYDSLNQKLKIFQDRIAKIEKAKTIEEVKMHNDFCETLKEGIEEYISYCENDLHDMKGLSKEQELAFKKQIQEAQDKFLQLREDQETKKKEFMWKVQAEQQKKIEAQQKKFQKIPDEEMKKGDQGFDMDQKQNQKQKKQIIKSQDILLEPKKEEQQDLRIMDKQQLYKTGIGYTEKMKEEAVEAARNLNQIQEMAEAIVEKQVEQKTIMTNIDNNLEQIESEMKRAQRQIKQIATRLFTDKCILALICLIICAVIFLIIYGAIKNKKGTHFSIPKDKVHK